MTEDPIPQSEDDLKKQYPNFNEEEVREILNKISTERRNLHVTSKDSLWKLYERKLLQQRIIEGEKLVARLSKDYGMTEQELKEVKTMHGRSPPQTEEETAQYSAREKEIEEDFLEIQRDLRLRTAELHSNQIALFRLNRLRVDEMPEEAKALWQTIKYGALAALCGGAVGALAAYLPTRSSHHEQIDELNASYSSCKTSSETALKSNKNNISDLEGKVGLLQGKVDALKEYYDPVTSYSVRYAYGAGTKDFRVEVKTKKTEGEVDDDYNLAQAGAVRNAKKWLYGMLTEGEMDDIFNGADFSIRGGKLYVGDDKKGRPLDRNKLAVMRTHYKPRCP